MRTLLRLAGVGLCAAYLGACATSATMPPFNPVANVDQLMDGVITPAAEIYWESVSIIVDANGVTENQPETDAEWEAVWAAAMTLAESGNLLMIAPRAVDDNTWMGMSAALVEVGAEAAEAALAQDPEAVLAVGERVYNVCTACHTRYLVGAE